MKNITGIKVLMIALIAGLFLSVPFCAYSQEVIDIQVSPSTLNLQNNGEVVTVHTDIAFSLVVGETVSMNGIEIDSWKADLQGNFVAKFVMQEIVGLPLLIGDYNELTLTGTKTDGSTFTGTDMVMVIDVVQKGKK